MLEKPRTTEAEDVPNNMHFGRNPRNQGTILFVGNLPFQTPWQHVKDHFRNAGKVRYTDLIADRHGHPKGSALVTMMTPDGAENAIRMFNETDFQGRRLIVRKFDDGPRPSLVERDMMPPYTISARQPRAPYNAGAVGNVGVAGFYANDMGAVNGAAPYTRAAPSVSYGRPAGLYHAADMDESMGAAAAGKEMVGPDQVPKPRSQRVSEVGRKLFVSNLPFDCTSNALRETFQQVGNVERAEIMMGRGGRSRGMGIIVMETENEARIAIAEFDGIEMAGRAMIVRLDSKAE